MSNGIVNAMQWASIRRSIYMVLITGSRDWTDYVTIRTMLRLTIKAAGLQKRPDRVWVIQGGASGADALAEKAALELGCQPIRMIANWDRYHRAAGPIRNRNMVRMMPNSTVAFHKDLKKSKGTADCVKQSMAMGIETIHVKGRRVRDTVVLMDSNGQPR